MSRRRTTAIVVLVTALLLVVPIPLRGRAFNAAFDAGHLVIGAALGFIASRCLAWLGMSPSWLRDGLALLGAAVAGTGIEWLQGFVGREPSWGDAATNVLGAGAWFLGHRARVAPSAGLRRVAIGGVILLLAAGLLMPVLTAVDALRQSWSWPVLASFEDRLELSRLSSWDASCSVDAAWASEGTTSLRVDLRPGDIPGASLDSVPEDWSDYAAVAYDLLVIGDEPLPLILEVEDQHHTRGVYDPSDRFRLVETYTPGRHSVRVELADIRDAPKTRRLNLRRMYGLTWFVQGLETPRTFHLDNVRLLAR